MIILRNSSAYRSLQYNLAKNSTTLNELYVKASTGVDVAKASDEPSAVQSLLSSRSEIVKSERYVENALNIQDSLSTAETYINSAKEIFDRASEIAVAAANSSLSTGDLNTYIDEVEQLQENLLDLANTQVDGKYIFAGYTDETLPFSGDPVTYNGTSDNQMLSVSGSTTMAKNITGDELFTSPVDLFATLDDLVTALQSGDETTISDQLTQLEAGAEQIRTQQSLLGNNLSQLDDVISMHENSILLLEEKLSRIQDADLTEVLSEVTQMELSLEATMEVTSRVSALNLFDYL